MRAALAILALGGCALLSTGCAATHSYPDGTGLTGQLEREIVALRTLNTQLQASCGGPERPDQVFAEMSGVFAGSEVTVTREGRVTVVSIPVVLLFADPWSMQVRAEATGPLDLLATAMNLHPEYTITVEGHSSDRSIPLSVARQYADHLVLSFAYASAVQLRLTNDYKVAPERFTVAARGEWEPIASNDIPSGQAQNDRVVVYLERVGSAVPAGAGSAAP